MSGFTSSTDKGLKLAKRITAAHPNIKTISLIRIVREELECDLRTAYAVAVCVEKLTGRN